MDSSKEIHNSNVNNMWSVETKNPHLFDRKDEAAGSWQNDTWHSNLSLVFLLITNPTNGLCFHQFSMSETTENSKSLNTDANRANY